ncbi:MAG: SOS response-associated peptidase [Solirubrobacteraceae bacterium]
MCGRYTNTAKPNELEARFGVVIPFSEGTQRFNSAPTEPVLAVVPSSGKHTEEAPQHEARALRWGLVPAWANDTRGSFKLINARSETVDKRPAFRGLLADSRRRALLPADGFYEWLRSEDPKQPRQPFRFTVDDGQPFAFAALWTTSWIEDELVASATMLTTQANELVSPLHARMPVILPGRDAEHAWLDKRLDATAAKGLCVPLDPARMSVCAANPIVNKAGVEGPDVLLA